MRISASTGGGPATKPIRPARLAQFGGWMPLRRGKPRATLRPPDASFLRNGAFLTAPLATRLLVENLTRGVRQLTRRPQFSPSRDAPPCIRPNAAHGPSPRLSPPRGTATCTPSACAKRRNVPAHGLCFFPTMRHRYAAGAARPHGPHARPRVRTGIRWQSGGPSRP